MNNDKTIETKARFGWLLAVPLLGALAVSAVAHAGSGRGGGHDFGGEGGFGMGRGRHMGHLLGTANATDAQKAQIKAAWESARPQLKAFHEQGRKLREELHKTLAAATIDQAKVEDLRRQSLQLADKASAVSTKALITSAQVLTPEQRQKVAASMQEHRGRGHREKAE